MDNKEKEKHNSMFLLTDTSRVPVALGIVILGGQQGSYMRELAENRELKLQEGCSQTFF